MRDRIQLRLRVVACGMFALALSSVGAAFALAGTEVALGPDVGSGVRLDVVRAKLRPADFEEAEAVPFAAEYEISGTLPVQLAGAEFSTREGFKRLEIDVRGGGNYSKKIPQRKPAVVELDTDDGVRKLLVYWRSGSWFSASASCLVGKVLGQPVLLLDADLDGEYLGPRDYVRVGAGCPMACDERKQIMIGKTMYTMGIDTSGRKAELTLEALPRPKGASKMQWSALTAMNEFRRAVGLPPRSLNLERTSACQLHAEYLYLNSYDYTKPWDGVGSHEEVIGNPGYTPEGREAARRSVTGGSGDPAARVKGMSRTMLHRVAFVGPVGEGIGVGAVDKSKNAGARGYSVIWAGSKDVAVDRPPVTVPGPGQVGVGVLGRAERPNPQVPEDFYKVPRGYPVSVSYGGRLFSNVGLKLFEDNGKKEVAVEGYLFTPEKPIHTTRPDNSLTAFFMPRKSLKAKTRYVAEFVADEGGQAVRMTWTFTTGKS